MAQSSSNGFLSGVIEGFYGQPWSLSERSELFGWMLDWGLNTYLYAPKDDLKHRAAWREDYSPAELFQLRAVLDACRTQGIRFIYAIGPGLDIRYSDPSELARLQARFQQLLGLGCQDFAILFDDIPDRMNPADQARHGSFASAQCHVANALLAWVRERHADARFFFCPTPYCGRMAAAGLGGPGYLETVGRELAPEIDVFWTGPEIISREISAEHVAGMTALFRRPPVIWDNLHANDYDGRRFYCGPFCGRPESLRTIVRGILSNPNSEFPLNYVGLRTLGEFVNGTGAWDPRAAYLRAVEGWWPRFRTTGAPFSLEDLVLLADCYYLPYCEGEKARELYDIARRLLARPPTEWGPEAAVLRQLATRLREACVRMTELVDRPLFYALNRRVWELREEMDLLEKFVGHHLAASGSGRPFHSDFHLWETYRGGMVPRLQRLLVQNPDGSLTPSPGLASSGPLT